MSPVEPPIIVSVAPRADSRTWKQQQTDWPGYLRAIRLQDPSDHKECGGLLPAALRNTSRTNDDVLARYVATLDADSADLDLPERLLDALPDVRFAWHTTWRHSPADPRYRVHIPFSREVTPAEYVKVSRALVRFLGAASFDLTTSTQPAQFSWLASTSDPRFYESGVHDGVLLDPDHWLHDADDDETARFSLALETDDAPPTPTQKDKAVSILRKYEWEVSNLKDKATGSRLDGRNVALISRLPTLYRFVLADCLSERLVYESMWAAVQRAPGDHDFSEQEFRTVVRRALAYATTDGPGKPTVANDFTDVPLPDDADDDDDLTLPPRPTEALVSLLTPRRLTLTERLDDAGIVFSPNTYRPLNNNGTRGPIQFNILAADLARFLNLAVAEYQGSPDRKDLMTFYAGCWREDGVDLVRAALIRIFGNDWKPSIEDTTLRFLSATSTLPQVPIETPDPYLINVANGMYDIEFGALAPHDPTFFSRNQIPVAYDPDAECPLFDSWLAEVLRPDQIPVMWEVIGYTLFPRNHLHRAVLLHGSTGRNGKSTLLKVLSALVGKENVSNVSFSTLTNPSTGRFALEQLRGKLLNSAGEQDAGKMPTALLKQLISGDPLQADRKNKAFISFTPHALQVVATNSNITSNDHSEALADRFVIFEFERTFYGVEDPTLGDRLTAPAELQGILARALDALDRLLERGRFDLSQEMLDDRNEYAAAMGGSVREWLHAYTVPEPDGRIEKPQAWQAYQDACLLDNVRTTVTKNQFYRALEGMSHIKEVRVKGTRYFKGIVLNDEAVAPSEFV